MSTIAPASLARIAEEQFCQRRAALRLAVENGRFDAARANHNAQLWLAIAAAAGARLPELQVPTIWPIGGKIWMRADDLADPAEWRTELARARDRALAMAKKVPHDLKADQRARDLIALASALGAPPPASGGEAA